jgi:hypothetical protein
VASKLLSSSISFRASGHKVKVEFAFEIKTPEDSPFGAANCHSASGGVNKVRELVFTLHAVLTDGLCVDASPAPSP